MSTDTVNFLLLIVHVDSLADAACLVFLWTGFGIARRRLALGRRIWIARCLVDWRCPVLWGRIRSLMEGHRLAIYDRRIQIIRRVVRWNVRRIDRWIVRRIDVWIDRWIDRWNVRRIDR